MLPNAFAHLRDDMVQHPFLQWERLSTHVWRAKGHQFRCASEYLYDKVQGVANWYGWCTPSPETKKYKGEAVTLVTAIPRWKESKDVVLDIQTRQGSPAVLQLYVEVLRIRRRITRSQFVHALQGYYSGELDFIFYKGRIWPEGSTTEIAVSHCDTFTILTHRETPRIEDEEDSATNGTCDHLSAGRANQEGGSSLVELRPEDSPQADSEDSFT